jgi:Fe-Mn family superoxide dismutase
MATLDKPFALPPLRFGYDDLAPVIDGETMRLHHDRHHRAYVDGINAALASYPQWQGLTIEAVLRRLAEVPLAICEAVRNQGGGHANHQFFWKIICPGGSPMPAGLQAALERDFGSVETFKQRFEAAGAAHFGSGWAFLVGDPVTDRLEILTLPNQDSVLTLGKFGLLCCDLWEHAYYLTYRNRRAEWLRAWWDIVDWQVVGQRLTAMRTGAKLA